MTPMRALVTGAAGFVGRRLVARLLHDGHEVRMLLRQGLLAPLPEAAEAERTRGDVRDADSMIRATAGRDIVFHCAWGGGTLEDARAINVTGTENVIRAAVHCGVGRVVHVSSMAVHGYDLPAVLTEDCSLTTNADTYAITKAEGEQVARKLAHELGIELVILRPTIVYGPGAPLWLLHYFQRAKNGKLRVVRGTTGRANLVHVTDLVEALMLAARVDCERGRAFLISGPSPVLWREYFEALSRLCGRTLPREIGPMYASLLAYGGRGFQALLGIQPSITPMDLRFLRTDTVVDTSRAQNELGYQASLSLSDGIADCARWLAAQGYLPPQQAGAEGENAA